MFLYDEPMSECYHCSQKEDTLGEIKYWFNAVLDQFYGRDEFNSQEIERFLQEISSTLGVKMPPEPITNTLNTWIEYNNNYLKSLTAKGS